MLTSKKPSSEGTGLPRASLPSPVAWIAHARIDAQGRRCQGNEPHDLSIFAVCVHTRFPTESYSRLVLMGRVLERARAHFGIVEGRPSLWVFPGGFFRPSQAGSDTKDSLKTALVRVADQFRTGAFLALGVDWSSAPEDQNAWVVRGDAQDSEERVIEIQRGNTPLSRRMLRIGDVQAAFFVCGELAGSDSDACGPYYDGELLEDPIAKLPSCRLLVAVAHAYIRGNVNGTVPNPRWAHQRRMEEFAEHGAAVLTHHHDGRETAPGIPRSDDQSDWIILKGGDWLGRQAVEAVP